MQTALETHRGTPTASIGTSAHPMGVSRDPRTSRTRKALRAALAEEIIDAGDLSRVTVTAVTERAGLTRRTFYSHFRDIPELVDRIEEETCNGLRPLVAKLSAVTLDELSVALDACEACPGARELLEYFKQRASYLSALLGNGGDPKFRQRIEDMVRDVVTERAQKTLAFEPVGRIFDYYLTYAISAEVGVLVRWLTTGASEDVDSMACVMTGLMFVRPGDLYGRKLDFDVPTFGVTLFARSIAHTDE